MLLSEGSRIEQAMPDLAKARGGLFDLRSRLRNHGFLNHLAAAPLKPFRMLIPVITQPWEKAWAWFAAGAWDIRPAVPRIVQEVDLRSTVVAKPTARGLPQGRDEVLEKGLEVVLDGHR